MLVSGKRDLKALALYIKESDQRTFKMIELDGWLSDKCLDLKSNGIGVL